MRISRLIRSGLRAVGLGGANRLVRRRAVSHFDLVVDATRASNGNNTDSSSGDLEEIYRLLYSCCSADCLLHSLVSAAVKEAIVSRQCQGNSSSSSSSWQPVLSCVMNCGGSSEQNGNSNNGTRSCHAFGWRKSDDSVTPRHRRHLRAGAGDIPEASAETRGVARWPSTDSLDCQRECKCTGCLRVAADRCQSRTVELALRGEMDTSAESIQAACDMARMRRDSNWDRRDSGWHFRDVCHEDRLTTFGLLDSRIPLECRRNHRRSRRMRAAAADDDEKKEAEAERERWRVGVWQSGRRKIKEPLICTRESVTSHAALDFQSPQPCILGIRVHFGCARHPPESVTASPACGLCRLAIRVRHEQEVTACPRSRQPQERRPTTTTVDVEEESARRRRATAREAERSRVASRATQAELGRLGDERDEWESGVGDGQPLLELQVGAQSSTISSSQSTTTDAASTGDVDSEDAASSDIRPRRGVSGGSRRQEGGGGGGGQRRQRQFNAVCSACLCRHPPPPLCGAHLRVSTAASTPSSIGCSACDCEQKFVHLIGRELQLLGEEEEEEGEETKKCGMCDYQACLRLTAALLAFADYGGEE